MMHKSLSSLLLLALVVLATLVSAQDSNAPTATSTAAPTSAPGSVTTTTLAPLPTITNRPGSNYTGPAPGQFTSLQSVIESYASGRAANPGSSPTPNAGKGGNGAASLSMDKTVVLGSVMVLVTVALSTAGFLGL